MSEKQSVFFQCGNQIKSRQQITALFSLSAQLLIHHTLYSSFFLEKNLSKIVLKV